jgi:hypothetical protein
MSTGSSPRVGPVLHPGSERYRFGTGCSVRCVQNVHARGHGGRSGRSREQRASQPVGWGPKGRWFKSSRRDSFVVHLCVPSDPATDAVSRSEWCFAWKAAVRGEILGVRWDARNETPRSRTGQVGIRTRRVRRKSGTGTAPAGCRAVRRPGRRKLAETMLTTLAPRGEPGFESPMTAAGRRSSRASPRLSNTPKRLVRLDA